MGDNGWGSDWDPELGGILYWKNKADDIARAAQSLINESKGFLSQANPHDHGYTNIECLKLAIKNAENSIYIFREVYWKNKKSCHAHGIEAKEGE